MRHGTTLELIYVGLSDGVHQWRNVTDVNVGEQGYRILADLLPPHTSLQLTVGSMIDLEVQA